MDNTKHIWEGWTVQNFIDELEPSFNMIINSQSWKKPFKTKDEIKEWCKDNQPYYKKHIPEVYKYFVNKSGL
jgi:hypothetical protein